MKTEKFIFFAFGILAVLLAGCFNAVTVGSPGPEGGEESILDYSPFPVDIIIGEVNPSRSIAGPSTERIKGDIRNIIQLIVMNDVGDVIAFDEIRRAGEDEKEAVLNIPAIEFNKNYHFLLLMGHWERDYALEQTGSGVYVYKNGSPTLLAAGLEDKFVTGSGIITITMWPIVVDTKFTTVDATIVPSKMVEPVVTDGEPLKASLLPVGWKVTWTINRGVASGNGLVDLIRAQKIVDNEASNSILSLKSKRTIVRGTGLNDSEVSYTAASGDVITLVITDYTGHIHRIGKNGSANFNLEYIPFNKTIGWNAFDSESVFDLTGNNAPVWVIRNGVNDAAQNNATNFKNLGNGIANGNGAVSFMVAAGIPDPGELIIKDGKFFGPAGSTTPDIGFKTEGYDGEADVYYAVVPKGDTPDWDKYQPLDPVAIGDHRKEIELLDPAQDYDIWVVLVKDGDVSEPLVINTKKGGGGVNWTWGAGIDYVWGDE
jgi:hypothetical protein